MHLLAATARSRYVCALTLLTAALCTMMHCCIANEHYTAPCILLHYSVYGRNETVATSLRTLHNGTMKLSKDGLPLLQRDGKGELKWLLADDRSASLLGTLVLHTVLLREHNRRALQFTPEYLAKLQQQFGCTPKPCTEVSYFARNRVLYSCSGASIVLVVGSAREYCDCCL
jgi:Animal haem peroxidase